MPKVEGALGGVRQVTIEFCENLPEADKKHKKFCAMSGKPVIERVSEE